MIIAHIKLSGIEYIEIIQSYFISLFVLCLYFILGGNPKGFDIIIKLLEIDEITIITPFWNNYDLFI